MYNQELQKNVFESPLLKLIIRKIPIGNFLCHRMCIPSLRSLFLKQKLCICERIFQMSSLFRSSCWQTIHGRITDRFAVHAEGDYSVCLQASASAMTTLTVPRPAARAAQAGTARTAARHVLPESTTAATHCARPSASLATSPSTARPTVCSKQVRAGFPSFVCCFARVEMKQVRLPNRSKVYWKRKT